MSSVARNALAVFFRFSVNDNDAPSLDDLKGAQSHWDDSYGKSIADRMAEFDIDDTVDNRAWVQLLASMAPGSNKQQLTHGCNMFANVLKLPEGVVSDPIA